jgi:hypothetical protein
LAKSALVYFGGTGMSPMSVRFFSAASRRSFLAYARASRVSPYISKICFTSVIFNQQSKYLTNTTPGNFIYLGVLAKAFPGALFIWNRRDKNDTILYNYFNNYKAGHSYATDIGYIEDYFMQYEKLMNFWKELMPMQFIETYFEENVLDPRLVINQINSNKFMNDSINTNEASLKEIINKSVSYQKTIGHYEHYKEFIDRLS